MLYETRIQTPRCVQVHVSTAHNRIRC